MVISFMEIKCISIELISRFCNFYSFGHHSFMVAYNTVPIFLVEWNQKELYQRIEIFERFSFQGQSSAVIVSFDLWGY